MGRLSSISIFVIALLTVLEVRPQAQTAPPAAAQKTDKPALNADKLAIEWVDRMNALSSWYLTADGKEDEAQNRVDHLMEIFATDVIAEVPPHDDRQQGTVELVGSTQVRKWVEKI